MKRLVLALLLFCSCSDSAAEQLAACGRACGFGRMTQFASGQNKMPGNPTQRWDVLCQCLGNDLLPEMPESWNDQPDAGAEETK